MEITVWLLNVKASAWEDNQVKWMLQVYYLAQEQPRLCLCRHRERSGCGRNRLLPQHTQAQFAIPYSLPN